MEWNGECAQLQLTCVTGAVQSIVSLGLLSRVYEQVGIAHVLLYPSMVL